MATKQELLDAIAEAVNVDTTDIKLIKIDLLAGSMRIEIDGLDLDADGVEEEEEDDLDIDDDEADLPDTSDEV